MKPQVGFVKGVEIGAAAARDGFHHVVERGFEQDDVGAVRARGGECSRSRLDHRADFRQLAQERGPRRLVMFPRHDVGIEQVPRLPRRDAGADLRLGLDQPFCGEHLDCLAQRGAAGRHRRPRLQRVSGLNVAAQDSTAERVHDLPVQIAVRVASGDVGHVRGADMIILYPPCAFFSRRWSLPG